MGKARIETDYLLVLRPEPSRPDRPTVHQRLRSTLTELRHHGLRCLRIAPVLPAEPPQVVDGSIEPMKGE